MHNTIMRLSELITVTLLIANKERAIKPNKRGTNLQPDFRSLVFSIHFCEFAELPLSLLLVLLLYYKNYYLLL